MSDSSYYLPPSVLPSTNSSHSPDVLQDFLPSLSSSTISHHAGAGSVTSSAGSSGHSYTTHSTLSSAPQPYYDDHGMNDNGISRRGGIMSSLSKNNNANNARRTHTAAPQSTTTARMANPSAFRSHHFSYVLPAVSESHPNNSNLEERTATTTSSTNHSSSRRSTTTSSTTYYSFLSNSSRSPPTYHIRGAPAAASTVSNSSHQTATTGYYSSASSNSSRTIISGNARSNVRSQRFRDEPGKRSIVKTEMCEAFPNCEFGSKCNYAHHESELKYRTILERHDEGLIDKETFRTRPCWAYITTGSW